MSTAIVDVDGNVRQLDARADAPAVVTAEDVQDPERLARLLNEMRQAQANTGRRWAPRVVFVEDRAVASGDTWRIEHGFGGRVRYWVVDWRPTAPGDAPLFDFDADSDGGTLLLTVGNTGTVTLLVMEAG